MRGIVAREHRIAVAERRDAQAAGKAARLPAKSYSAWKKGGGPIEPTPRAPEAIAADAPLRARRQKVETKWDHKREGTAPTYEAAERAQSGPLARLWLSGAIDADQLASAVEIATVAERIARDVTVRTASLETRIDNGGFGSGSGFDERLGQVRREIAYGRWRRALGPSAAPVLDMIVGHDGVSGPGGYSVVARRYRMRPSRAKTLLIDALDLWPEMIGRVCKEVDQRDLDWAHARAA